jgi:hypothetical protein
MQYHYVIDPSRFSPPITSNLPSYDVSVLCLLSKRDCGSLLILHGSWLLSFHLILLATLNRVVLRHGLCNERVTSIRREPEGTSNRKRAMREPVSFLSSQFMLLKKSLWIVTSNSCNTSTMHDNSMPFIQETLIFQNRVRKALKIGSLQERRGRELCEGPAHACCGCRLGAVHQGVGFSVSSLPSIFLMNPFNLRTFHASWFILKRQYTVRERPAKRRYDVDVGASRLSSCCSTECFKAAVHVL